MRGPLSGDRAVARLKWFELCQRQPFVLIGPTIVRAGVQEADDGRQARCRQNEALPARSSVLGAGVLGIHASGDEHTAADMALSRESGAGGARGSTAAAVGAAAGAGPIVALAPEGAAGDGDAVEPARAEAQSCM